MNTNLKPIEIPITKKLLTADKLPQKTRCMLITHLLPTAVPYIRHLHSVYPVEAILAIPYSLQSSVADVLNDEGFNVIVPKSIKEMFVLAFENAKKLLDASNDPLVIQEIGGYLAEVTRELSSYGHFLGVVEDTNNGHWRYEQYGPHLCPILSIAQSPLKAIEDTLIGDATTYSVERILREEFHATIQGMCSGVLGFGKIGTSNAIALRGRESAVHVYDKNSGKNIRAKVEGFYPTESQHYLLKKCHLIIGCTGETSISVSDVPSIKDGAILASSSSKDVEFDLEGFATICDVAEISEIIQKYTKGNGESFYVLCKGFPVNFRDLSILGSITDLMYGELSVCMRYLREKRIPSGLHRSPPEIQKEVANVWLEVYPN